MNTFIDKVLTNPIFIVIIIIIIIGIVVAIVVNQLKGAKRKIYRLIENNRDYLEAKIPEINAVIENAINVYITDQTLIKELTRLRELTITNTKDVSQMIAINNEIYKFINNPLIKSEEYQSFNESINNTYNNNYTEDLTIERKNYNTEATAFNTKLTTFPTSFIAKIIGTTPLPLFEDEVVKVTNNINNSVSYLNNNYNINQETIKSPEVQVEEKSNLFIAKQNKPQEAKVIIEAPIVTANQTESVNQDITYNEPQQIENQVVVNNQTLPENQISVIPDIQNIEGPITINEEVNVVPNSNEPISINSDSPVPQSEAAVSVNEPISENKEIEIVASSSPKIDGPITINENTPISTNEIINNPISINDESNEVQVNEKNEYQPNTDTSQTVVISNSEVEDASNLPQSEVVNSDVATQSIQTEIPTFEVEPVSQNQEPINIGDNSEPAAQAEPVVEAPEQPKRFCPNCNKITTERFCPDCGYPTE